MAKVMLISPPYIDLYGRLKWAAGRYFHLGVGYIAAYLRSQGNHTVSIYEMDSQGYSLDTIATVIKQKNPDIIGLTCATPNFIRAVELAKIAKRCSNAIVVLGGVHASALSEFIMGHYSEYIDFIVRGEGEITMLELANKFNSKENLNSIAGLVYKQNDKIVAANPRPFIERLDAIPFPARDLINPKIFMPNLHNARYRNCFSILTSRGCPFNCSFCASRLVSGDKYRTHSAEYVLDEMEMLKRAYGAEQLIITDDTFTINQERVEKICLGMIERKLNLAWFCFSQVNTVNKQLLQLMKRAGCYNIGFGIESGCERIREKIGKSISTGRALEIVRVANGMGIKTQTFFIFGFPGETFEEMQETIQFAKRISSTLVFFNMLVPYPGTREFEHYFSTVPLDKIQWEDFVAVGERCVLKYSNIPPELIENLLGNAYIQYYTHPLRLIRLLRHIKTGYEFANYLKAGMGLFSQVFAWRNPGRSTYENM